MADRALLFVDGNNWYHACRSEGVTELFALDYAAISRKLAGPRQWVGTRYYIGALKQHHSGYREQRQFLARLQNRDPRIQVRLGRIEERPKENELSAALLHYLATTPHNLEPQVRQQLQDLANQHKQVSFLKEKAADIFLAVDMYRMAKQDDFEAAYLLSADGDFSPVVEAVKELGKKVYVASPGFSSALRSVADAFIPLRKEWFQDCYS